MQENKKIHYKCLFLKVKEACLVPCQLVRTSPHPFSALAGIYNVIFILSTTNVFQRKAVIVIFFCMIPSSQWIWVSLSSPPQGGVPD